MDYDIEIIKSRRRTISVEIRPDLRVIVRAPYRMPKAEIVKFISEKQRWRSTVRIIKCFGRS